MSRQEIFEDFKNEQDLIITSRLENEEKIWLEHAQLIGTQE